MRTALYKPFFLATACAFVFAFLTAVLGINMVIALLSFPIIYIVLIPILIRNEEKRSAAYIITGLSFLYFIPLFIIFAEIGYFLAQTNVGDDYFTVLAQYLPTVLGELIIYLIVMLPIALIIALVSELIMNRNKKNKFTVRTKPSRTPNR